MYRLFGFSQSLKRYQPFSFQMHSFRIFKSLVDKSPGKLIYCFLFQKVVEDARNRDLDNIGKALEFMRKYQFLSKRNPFFGFRPKTITNGGLDDELSLLAQKLRDILITSKKSLYGANNR